MEKIEREAIADALADSYLPEYDEQWARCVDYVGRAVNALHAKGEVPWVFEKNLLQWKRQIQQRVNANELACGLEPTQFKNELKINL